MVGEVRIVVLSCICYVLVECEVGLTDEFFFLGLLQQPQAVDDAAQPLDDLGVLHVDEDLAFIYPPGVHLWHGHPWEALADGVESDGLLSPHRATQLDHEVHAVKYDWVPAPDEVFLRVDDVFLAFGIDAKLAGW